VKPEAAPICPHCSIPSVFLASSASIYGRDYGPVYACQNGCDAYVGVHEGTRIAKGTLANKPLREARKAAHRLFDPLWKDLRQAYPEIASPPRFIQSTARVRAYRWLAEQLAIPFDDCHIAMFDLAMCAAAIAVIQKSSPTSATVRTWFKSIDRSVA
jgi:zinc-finger-containing domain